MVRFVRGFAFSLESTMIRLMKSSTTVAMSRCCRRRQVFRIRRASLLRSLWELLCGGLVYQCGHARRGI